MKSKVELQVVSPGVCGVCFPSLVSAERPEWRLKLHTELQAWQAQLGERLCWGEGTVSLNKNMLASSPSEPQNVTLWETGSLQRWQVEARGLDEPSRSRTDVLMKRGFDIETWGRTM